MRTKIPRPLPAAALRWRCSPSRVARASRAADLSLVEALGQPDALEALRLGLELYAPGYHVFVAGPRGLGKPDIVRGLLDELSLRCELPHDRVYVNNFRHPERPRLLELARGRGKAFSAAVDHACTHVADAIRRLAEDEGYARRREEIVSSFRERERRVLDAFEKACAERGFAPGQVEGGAAAEPDVLYLVGDQGISMGDLDAAIRAGTVKAEAEASIRAAHAALRAEMTVAMRRARAIARERAQELEALQRTVARRVVDEAATDLRGAFGEPAVVAWLEQAREHFVDRFSAYAQVLLEAVEASSGRPDAFRLASEEALREFRVNVLLDGRDQHGCPVVVEDQPTWTNLFGQVERESDGKQGVRTDFLLIRAGSLLRADGGYLVLHARDVLAQEGLWEELKRVLRHGRLEIRTPEAFLATTPTVLHPEPIPVNVKVVLIGDEGTWYAMREGDPEFPEIFKVKATFEGDVPLDDAALHRYATWLHRLVREERRLPLDPAAVAYLAEEGVREAGRQGRISVRFGRLADLVREAHHVATREGASRVSAGHLRRAQLAAARRHGVEERRVREAVREGLLLVQTSGRRVGQVNGLAVYDFGEHRFGKVARITAAVGAGQAGVVNVERMVELSGSSHDKGVLILSGYLRETFGADRPLAFTASLVFEQSYGGVEGDSATCAEVFATLSALARAPVRQDLAVTGSMNQHGDVQAVGGVNDKVEAFFDLCAERGLSGTQGVVIPRANAKDLMLREDVVDACRRRRFAIYAIDRVEEGLSLLTGRPAGVGPQPGVFAKGSLYADVAARLARLAAAAPSAAASGAGG